ELASMWEERPREEALSLATGLFPSVLIDAETVAAVDRALSDEGLPGPLRRILAEGKDGLERGLRARAADREGSS
ncbi:MAG: aminopeptidase, partial [Acidimicrobiaceae bacterium]